MTEFDIQKCLFDHFLTLNEFSRIEYITESNVHFPNRQFSVPDDKRWFDLSVQNAEPTDAFLMENSQYRFAGTFKIDIYTPQDCGEEECLNKYRWIAKLFNDAELDVVDIMKVYISTKGNDADYYRLQVTIEWTADIDKE